MVARMNVARCFCPREKRQRRVDRTSGRTAEPTSEDSSKRHVASVICYNGYLTFLLYPLFHASRLICIKSVNARGKVSFSAILLLSFTLP